MDIDADVRIVFFYVRALTVGLAKIIADGIFDAKRGKSDAFKRRAAGRKFDFEGVFRREILFPAEGFR